MSANRAVPVLHIHGQPTWHDPVSLIGNRPALKALRALIDIALGEAPAPGIDPEELRQMMAADGEGYSISVRLLDEGFGHGAWNRERRPYFDEMARDTRPWNQTTPLES